MRLFWLSEGRLTTIYVCPCSSFLPPVFFFSTYSTKWSGGDRSGFSGDGNGAVGTNPKCFLSFFVRFDRGWLDLSRLQSAYLAPLWSSPLNGNSSPVFTSSRPGHGYLFLVLASSATTSNISVSLITRSQRLDSPTPHLSVTPPLTADAMAVFCVALPSPVPFSRPPSL